MSMWGEKIGKPVSADDVEPITWALAEYGQKLSATQLLAVIEQAHAFGRRLAGWFTEFDLLLTPTAAAPPPTLGTLTATREEPLRAALRSTPYTVFLYPWNLSGQPAISLPGHMTASGLPIGVQLVAASAREDLLFAGGVADRDRGTLVAAQAGAQLVERRSTLARGTLTSTTTDLAARRRLAAHSLTHGRGRDSLRSTALHRRVAASPRRRCG
jgi:Amidase